MEELEAREWSRHGKRRLYVNSANGGRVGWLDLTTGQQHLDDPHLLPGFEAAVTRWQCDNGCPLPSPRRGLADPSIGDLTANRAGAAARAQALRLRAERPLRTLLARLMGVHTDERAWRIGADGEEIVGRILSRLGEEWRAVHAVPVGDRGSDIDHVLVGPGGVYTINTKTHPGGNIWLAGNAFRVNNQPVPYLRNSRHEAERAARLLTAAAGRPVTVQPLIVLVAARNITIREEARGVVVLADHELHSHLRTEPPVLSPQAISAIYAVATQPITWAT